MISEMAPAMSPVRMLRLARRRSIARGLYMAPAETERLVWSWAASRNSRLEMNNLSQLSVGVDVGGTKVAAAAVTGTTIVETHERPTVQTSGRHLVDEIEKAAREVIDRAGTPVAVGVGVPSQIDFASGLVVTSVNIPLAGLNLRRELGDHLDRREVRGGPPGRRGDPRLA